MGIFSRNKKVVLEEVRSMCAVVSGQVLPIEETPDPVFAQKMMGDGVVFLPDEGNICACMDATVSLIFPTKHAIGLKSKEGIEVLIHIGLDTVELEGKPFQLLVKEGQQVKAGTALVEVDFAYIKEQGKEVYTPVVITNGDDWKDTVFEYVYGETVAGETSYCTMHAK